MSLTRNLALILMLTPLLHAQQAAPATVSAPGSDAEATARLQARLNDFGGLNRYREENAMLTPAEKGRVVFFGDSITDAWGHLADTGTFFSGKPYINRGISGQTTPQMLIRFHQDVLALHPKAVVILAGTNDIAGNTGPSTLAMIEDNFTSMVELAKAEHVRPIMASVLPTLDYGWHRGVEPAAKIRDLNAWLREFCKQQHITYLDYYSAMADADGGMKPGISKDGVHPNAAGYAIMAPLAEEALSK
jgi:lysophospholipase L1-like esterase